MFIPLSVCHVFFIISFLSPLHPLYPSSAPHSLSIDSIEFASFRLDIVSRRAGIIIQHIVRKQKAWKMNEWLVTIANSNIWQHTIQCGLALFRINYIIFWKIVSHSATLWWLPGVSTARIGLINLYYLYVKSVFCCLCFCAVVCCWMSLFLCYYSPTAYY